MRIDDLQPALKHCSHLIYGFIGINPWGFEIIPAYSSNGGANCDLYRQITELKRHSTGLKVILSIGGRREEENHKYLTLVNIICLKLYEYFLRIFKNFNYHIFFFFRLNRQKHVGNLLTPLYFY